MFDSVKEMTFGWMNAMENIEFASRFDISPEKCNMYVWRQDDNKTMPSIILLSTEKNPSFVRPGSPQSTSLPVGSSLAQRTKSGLAFLEL